MNQEVVDEESVDRRKGLASTYQACIRNLVGFVGVLSVGCSQATGPFFQPVGGFQPDRALVYLYFPIQVTWNDSQTILADGRVLTRLDREGYYPFLSPPGHITFAMEGWSEKRNVSLDVEAGQKYFVRVSLVGRGVFTHTRYYQLEVVPADVAIQEILGLRLMESCRDIQGCSGPAKGKDG